MAVSQPSDKSYALRPEDLAWRLRRKNRREAAAHGAAGRWTTGSPGPGESPRLAEHPSPAAPRRAGAPALRLPGRGRGGGPGEGRSPGTARRTVVIEGHGGLEVGKSPASRSVRTTRRRRQRTAREADCRERRVAPRRCRGPQGCETSPSARRTVVNLPEGTPAARASQNLGPPEGTGKNDGQQHDANPPRLNSS